MHIHHHDTKVGFRLWMAAILTLALVVFEIAAGVKSNGLSLFTDAAQNFFDALGLVLAWWATSLALKPADRLRTYGYHRAKVVIALFNAALLLPVVFEIGYHAVLRFIEPVAVNGTIIGAAGAVGLVVNVLVVLLLRSSSKQIHVQGAYMHNIADAASSILILASGLLIQYTGQHWIDLAMSGVICAVLVYSIWPITNSAVHILLEGTPEGIDSQEIKRALNDLPSVEEVHDLHIWTQNDGMPVMSCHIVVGDTPPERDQEVLQGIRALLRDQFDITHSTVQVEHTSCEQSDRCLWHEGSKPHD